MTPSDRPQFERELHSRWPRKFSKVDVDYWMEKLEPFSVSEITVALTEYRNNNRFRPNVSDMLGLMMKQAVHDQPNQQQQPEATQERSFADVVRRQMRIPREASAIECLMRYWRQQWWMYRTRNDVPASPAKDIADPQVRGAFKMCFERCVGSLMGEHVSREHAEIYAVWIDTGPEQFKGFLQDLRRTMVIDPFTAQKELEHANVF